MKGRIQNSVVEWASLTLSIIMKAATGVFEESSQECKGRKVEMSNS